MSQYLRDEYLGNLSLSENAIREINAKLVQLRDAENSNIGTDVQNPKGMVLTYIIRFDNQGFKLYDFNRMMEYFKKAKYVERIIMQLDSNEHILSFRNKGKGIEMRFDTKNIGNCMMVVQDDTQAWVDSTFLTIQETIKKASNTNYLIRNRFSAFIVQILGVLGGFLLSLWIAEKVSPKLNIQYSYGFSFVIAFLLFSNAWTFLYQAILNAINFFWPNISFGKHNAIYGFSRAVFFGALVTICASLIFGLATRIYEFVLITIK